MTSDDKKYGLLPTPPDPRDFPLGGVVEYPDLSELPASFEVDARRFVKDQRETDICTSEGFSAVSEDQEGVELFPPYVFAKMRMIMGAEPEEYGGDLRSMCKAAVRYGSLELADVAEVFGDSIATLYADGKVQELRDVFADWRNVPLAADSKAEAHRKQSFFAVDGPYDLFDNIRSAIWAMRADKRSVFTGINWRPSWNLREKGIVAEYDKSERSYGHAIKIFGWVGEPGADVYLKAQLSNGTGIGDGGVFYLSREAVNVECVFGAFTFHDMPPELARYKLGRISFISYWLKSIFS